MPDDDLTTGPPHLTVDAVVSAEELTPEDLAALDRVMPEPAAVMPLPPDWLRSPAQPRDGLESAVYLTRIRDSIQPWHSYATPPAVAECKAELEELIAADQAARAEWGDIDWKMARERQEIGAAAVAGTDIPARTDWDTVRLVVQARHEELARRVKAAHAAYLEAVKAALPAWREALVAEVARRHAEARKAFSGVRAKVDAWQAAIAAAHAVDAAAHPGDELPASPLPADVREMVGKGKGAAAALDAFLSSDHPVASGSYLRREDILRPQAYVREALARRMQACHSWPTWRREHYRFTQHSREFTSRYYVDQYGEARQRPDWSDSVKPIPSDITGL